MALMDSAYNVVLMLTSVLFLTVPSLDLDHCLTEQYVGTLHICFQTSRHTRSLVRPLATVCEIEDGLARSYFLLHHDINSGVPDRKDPKR